MTKILNEICILAPYFWSMCVRNSWKISKDESERLKEGIQQSRKKVFNENVGGDEEGREGYVSHAMNRYRIYRYGVERHRN